MEMSSVGLPSSTSSVGDYYQENGYVIVEKLIPETLIDDLLDAYRREIVPSKSKFYRQNTNRYETNVLTRHGYVANCFLDVHSFRRFDALRRASLEVLFHPSVLNSLEKITGFTELNLMQSMLFDANTATPPHQDWWYLDSVPSGNLLAAWIALEDIHEAAGRFYVFPKSQTVNLHTAENNSLSHSAWLKRVQRYFEENRSKIFAPALKKGDVLFWNSRTVHGALPTKDEKFSRKSLTAHYLPSHMSFGNLFTEKNWITYRRYNEHRYFANQPEYSMKAMLISRVKQTLYDHPGVLKLARKLQRHSISDI